MQCDTIWAKPKQMKTSLTRALRTSKEYLSKIKLLQIHQLLHYQQFTEIYKMDSEEFQWGKEKKKHRNASAKDL